MNANKEWWWVAVNGASATLCPFPLAEPDAYPTPEQWLGFATLAKARRAQRLLLNASMAQVDHFIKVTFPGLLQKGKVAYIRPDNPQPAQAATVWLVPR
jgi:hypothetical protein